MQNIKAFGFKTVQVNGQLVFTCNISVNRISNEDLPKIEGLLVYQTEKKFGKNKITKDTTQFIYSTMSYSEHSRIQKELGLFLEQLAITKIKNRFLWAHPEDMFIDYSPAFADLDF
jgi:hypothetical protein